MMFRWKIEKKTLQQWKLIAADIWHIMKKTIFISLEIQGKLKQNVLRMICEIAGKKNP
jgi:hypothetical protein